MALLPPPGVARESHQSLAQLGDWHPSAAALETLDSINGDAAIGLLVMPLIVAYALSVILLPIAFYRRRLVPLWVVGLAGTAFVLEVVAPGDVLAVAAAKYALAALATVAIAWRITQLSDSEWRNPETIDRT